MAMRSQNITDWFPAIPNIQSDKQTTKQRLLSKKALVNPRSFNRPHSQAAAKINTSPKIPNFSGPWENKAGKKNNKSSTAVTIRCFNMG